MKKMVLLLTLLGLTFMYNPQTRVGLVYFNDSDDHAIILVDDNTNTMTFYDTKFLYAGQKDKWAREFLKRFTPGTSISIITPVAKPEEKQF